MSDLLKEAIADAKAVRETALENAKMALEEAFTPQLKSMLSAKLKEDEFEDEEEFGGEPEVGEEEPEVPAEEGYYEDDEFGDEEEVPADEVPADEVPTDDEFGGEEEEEEGGLDLEAIIRELEAELSEDEGMYESDEPVEEATDETVEESDEPVEESTEEVDEEIEIDETILDEDEEEDEDKEEVDEVDKSSGIGNGTGRGNTDVSSGIGNGNNSLKEELKEYKEAVKFLKDKLHEVNILNAKLLFTNKLFKEFTLDNNQKLKVVETFDRAQTTREIKLVYSTLAEQFGDNGSITRKSISESASSAVSSTKPSKESTKVISEETNVANRFKKLAGLIKG
jgi:hypothetical protein